MLPRKGVRGRCENEPSRTPGRHVWVTDPLPSPFKMRKLAVCVCVCEEEGGIFMYLFPSWIRCWSININSRPGMFGGCFGNGVDWRLFVICVVIGEVWWCLWVGFCRCFWKILNCLSLFKHLIVGLFIAHWYFRRYAASCAQVRKQTCILCTTVLLRMVFGVECTFKWLEKGFT